LIVSRETLFFSSLRASGESSIMKILSQFF
jgi:hypothetical protein